MCTIVTQIMEVEAKIAQATEQNMPEAEIEVLRHELTSLEAQYEAKVNPTKEENPLRGIVWPSWTETNSS